MADNWFSSLFKSKSQDDKKISDLKLRLEDMQDKAREESYYVEKFFDIEPGTSSGVSHFELGGVDQMINDAVLQAFYASETWVYVAITAIAKTIGGLPLKLEKRTTDKQRVYNTVTGTSDVVDTEKWVDASGAKLFERFCYPNKCTTKSEFYMLIVIDLLSTGNAYIHLDSDEDLSIVANSEFDNDPNSAWGRIRNSLALNTKIKGLYRIPPPLIKPVPKAEGYGIEGYVMESDAGVYGFDTAEMVHIKLPNPLNLHVGLSPLVAAFKNILLDRFSTEHMVKFYKTGARLGGVITTEKNLNKEQISRFQRSFENNFSGRHNFHRTLILPPGMKYETIEQNPAETALLDFCKYNREAILAIFGVPPVKVGILDQASYANANAQVKLFFTDTIKPLLTFIEDGFNLKNTLLPDTKSYRVKFDLSEVEELRENNQEMATTAKIMIESGLSTNEVRARIWKAPPVDGGDKVKTIEDLSKPAPAFPFAGAQAPKGEIKDAVSNPQADMPTISADNKPTNLSYSQRVAQLTELYMQRDRLPMGEAIRRAVEQAKTEGLEPEDPNPPGPNSAPARNSDEGKAELQAVDGQLKPADAAKETQLIEQPKLYAFGMTKDQVVESWKSFIGKMDPLIEKRRAEVQKFFKQLKSLVMNQIGANIKAYGIMKARKSADADEILDADKFEALMKQYAKEIDAALLEAYKTGFTDTLTTFKFDARNADALEALSAYAADKVTGIVDTTRAQLKTILVEAFDQGVPVTEVAARINEKFDEINAGRAETIARTETLTAVSMGQEAKREEFKTQFPDTPMKKMWISAQDERVRDSHVELDGSVVGVDEEFKANLKFPRDPDCEDAAEVINCRCTTITFAEEDQTQVEATVGEGEEKSASKKKVHRHEDESVDDCVKRAIPLLINEGMPQDQAVAAAYSMCELPPKKGGPGSGRHPENGSTPKPAPPQPKPSSPSYSNLGGQNGIQVSERGQVKVSKPKNIDQAKTMLDQMTKILGAAEKEVKDNPKDFDAGLRLRHVVMQYTRAIGYAKLFTKKDIQSDLQNIIEKAEAKIKELTSMLDATGIPNEDMFEEKGGPGSGRHPEGGSKPSSLHHDRMSKDTVKIVQRREKGKGEPVSYDKQQLTEILNHGTFALISAGRNPKISEDVSLTDAEIKDRYSKLENDLKESGYAYTTVAGHYGGKEDSFLVQVHEAEKSEMIKLGKKYNQDSVIYTAQKNNEMIFTTGADTGKAVKGSGWSWQDNADDFYSEVTHADGTKSKFQLNFDFEAGPKHYTLNISQSQDQTKADRHEKTYRHSVTDG